MEDIFSGPGSFFHRFDQRLPESLLASRDAIPTNLEYNGERNCVVGLSCFGTVEKIYRENLTGRHPVPCATFDSA